MEQKDPEYKRKPGLPESIHPDIGNGSLWETDPHLLNLRTVEPGNELDQFLLEESQREAILRQWKAQFLNDPATDEYIDESQSLIQSLQPEKQKPKEKKVLTSTRDKGPKPEWFEAIEGDLILKEDPNKPIADDADTTDLADVVDTADATDTSDTSEVIDTTEGAEIPVPEGKRVRKAAKKAQKEQKAKKRKHSAPPIHSEEASLSPFTRWLKGLKGSEYVHPYEDDYGLEQLAGTGSEGISETFADLLAAQGYKDQALDMYKLLMAKYPEKSSFFAAKIEALK